MRELKFRAWHTKLNRYLANCESYLNQDGSIKCAFEVYKGEILESYCIESFSRDDFDNGYIIREDCTGLKDKDGKEIYEGDIVRWSFKGMNNRLIHTADAVEWESYAEEEWPYSTISGFTLPDSEDGYEVIGNIHENPELLGEEEE